MRRVYYILFSLTVLLLGCEWHLKQSKPDLSSIVIERFDIVESSYLIGKDTDALRQMRTVYSSHTHILVEEMLDLGCLNDSDVCNELYDFYQDSTLRKIVYEVGREFRDMDDVNKSLSSSFHNLKTLLPNIKIPHFYTQIGALNQSIIVGNGFVAISLDKYLGSDFSVYQSYYPEVQRKSMKRSMIVPDCIGFYLLSCYPSPDLLRENMNDHMARIQWVVNKVMKKDVFKSDGITAVEQMMRSDRKLTVEHLLTHTDNSNHVI